MMSDSRDAAPNQLTKRIEDYRASAERWASLHGRTAAANAESDRGCAIYRSLIPYDAARDAIAALMSRLDPWFRLPCCNPSLPWTPYEATKVLEALDRERGLVRISAEYTLREPRAGRPRPCGMDLTKIARDSPLTWCGFSLTFDVPTR
jgi:hypothetical protein